MRAIPLRALGWAAAIAALTPLAASAQRFGTDAVVHAGANAQNEISLTLLPGTQPGMPQALLAAYNDGSPGAGLGVSLSADGGANWTSTQLPFPAPSPAGPIPGAVFDTAFDPSATADTQGNLFVGHIAADTTAGFGGDNGMYVWRSSNGGQSWTQAVVSEAAAASGSPDASYRFNDRCQIAADRFAASPHKDNVYAAWIKDRGLGVGANSDVYFAYSTDGGATFTELAGTLNNTTTHPLGNMPIPRVAANGDVYVSWLDYDVTNHPNPASPGYTASGGRGTVYLTRSTDGGVTFAPEWSVTAIDLPYQTGASHPVATNPFSVSDVSGTAFTLAKGAPVLATSTLNPSDLYLVYAADPDRVYAPDGTVQSDGPEEADIFFTRSADSGVTWSAPHQFARPNDQVMPWMDVKPDGTIDLAWYDRRHDPADHHWDVYVTRSTDGGLTFLPELALNDQSFWTPGAQNAGCDWMGEYLGLAVDSGYGYVAWTFSPPDPLGDIYFDKFANASLTIIPEPSSLLLALVGACSLLGLRRWRRR